MGLFDFFVDVAKAAATGAVEGALETPETSVTKSISTNDDLPTVAIEDGIISDNAIVLTTDPTNQLDWSPLSKKPGNVTLPEDHESNLVLCDDGELCATDITDEILPPLKEALLTDNVLSVSDILAKKPEAPRGPVKADEGVKKPFEAPEKPAEVFTNIATAETTESAAVIADTPKVLADLPVEDLPAGVAEIMGIPKKPQAANVNVSLKPAKDVEMPVSATIDQGTGTIKLNNIGVNAAQSVEEDGGSFTANQGVTLTDKTVALNASGQTTIGATSLSVGREQTSDRGMKQQTGTTTIGLGTGNATNNLNATVTNTSTLNPELGKTEQSLTTTFGGNLAIDTRPVNYEVRNAAGKPITGKDLDHTQLKLETVHGKGVVANASLNGTVTTGTAADGTQKPTAITLQPSTNVTVGKVNNTTKATVGIKSASTDPLTGVEQAGTTQFTLNNTASLKTNGITTGLTTSVVGNNQGAPIVTNAASVVTDPKKPFSASSVTTTTVMPNPLATNAEALGLLEEGSTPAPINPTLTKVNSTNAVNASFGNTKLGFSNVVTAADGTLPKNTYGFTGNTTIKSVTAKTQLNYSQNSIIPGQTPEALDILTGVGELKTGPVSMSGNFKAVEGALPQTTFTTAYTSEAFNASFTHASQFNPKNSEGQVLRNDDGSVMLLPSATTLNTSGTFSLGKTNTDITYNGIGLFAQDRPSVFGGNMAFAHTGTPNKKGGTFNLKGNATIVTLKDMPPAAETDGISEPGAMPAVGDVSKLTFTNTEANQGLRGATNLAGTYTFNPNTTLMGTFQNTYGKGVLPTVNSTFAFEKTNGANAFNINGAYGFTPDGETGSLGLSRTQTFGPHVTNTFGGNVKWTPQGNSYELSDLMTYQFNPNNSLALNNKFSMTPIGKSLQTGLTYRHKALEFGVSHTAATGQTPQYNARIAGPLYSPKPTPKLAF